ncbi:hypothetical protein [Bifidobacterium callimiconis]|uniref:Uncharacterized protein n=1 Tax=Bifidobacterium callimiconis TaxID=2306973 RepID=A0A430FIN2_9BIFI|nr:hypothetical protein [Bifidobacterium callimiconis]RSX52667.1 hypothetical protein D2E23_0395 [Bifidobacterium callimiconis]
MIGEHVARIIRRWCHDGLTIDEIQENVPFVTHDDIVELISTNEPRKNQQCPTSTITGTALAGMEES